MPYFSQEALLPLPPTPEAGFRTGLSSQAEVIDDNNSLVGVDKAAPPLQE